MADDSLPSRSDKLRLFLWLDWWFPRLDRRLCWLLRRLFWYVRWLRWALFKNNLSFPGNVRFGDLLSKLLQIEFDLGDSLFQGFAFVWHMFVPIWTGLLKEVDSFLRAGIAFRPLPRTAISSANALDPSATTLP